MKQVKLKVRKGLERQRKAQRSSDSGEGLLMALAGKLIAPEAKLKGKRRPWRSMLMRNTLGLGLKMAILEIPFLAPSLLTCPFWDVHV
jgi:hypothetical protein